jgi:hypothetical protein
MLGRPKKPQREKKTARLNMMIEPKLRKAIHAYANKRSKSISALITDHFITLLEKEDKIDVEQI